MSLLGKIDDYLTGKPVGTYDASIAPAESAAAYDQQNAQLMQLNTDTYNRIASEQGFDAADAYWAQVQADYGTDAPAPGSAAATAQEIGAGLSTLPASLADPVGTFSNGLKAEGTAAGTVAGQVGNAAANALKNAGQKFFSQIPWWVYPLAGVVLFFALGGAEWLPLLRGKRKKS